MTYRIVATLGPATSDESSWGELACAGADAFRLNTSHFTVEDLGSWIDRLESFLGSQGTGEEREEPGIVLDLQGSKWRLGTIEPATVEEGQVVELVLSPGEAAAGDRNPAASLSLPVPHADFFAAAPVSGAQIAVNDAKVLLRREAIGEHTIRARVVLGGEVSANKGITFLDSAFRRESLTEKDRRVVELGRRRRRRIGYALSYVRDAQEMESYRKNLGDSAYLIAKIERETALAEAEQISRLADELWLCRGDLGAEMGLAAMAAGVTRFSQKVRGFQKPVLLAGQVLEHMTQHPTPTRSEICCLYEALEKGFCGLVLSDETAVGSFPVESCRSAALFRHEQTSEQDRSHDYRHGGENEPGDC
jgi:pyruvate kinase